MKYDNTNITAGDIAQWIADFTKAYEVIDGIDELSFEDKAYFKSRMYDALFLVAYVESNLEIVVNDCVYDRARDLQCVARSYSKGAKK